jgi:hypothetical protein
VSKEGRDKSKESDGNLHSYLFPLQPKAPPMTSILCLVKSGQAKQYFQQNITFLGQPEGAVVTTRYKRRWVCHAEGDELPETVLIFFSEPPYRHALPVRTARLLGYAFDETDGDFEYTLALGPLTTLPDFERVDAYLAEHRSGENVVFTAPAPPLPRVEGSPQSRWNAMVYHLVSSAYAGENNPYRHALFSFVHPTNLPRTLAVGQIYYQAISLLAPGLDAEAMRGVRAHTETPALDASVTIEGTIYSGQLRLAVRPLRPVDQDWQITLFFRPNDVASGQVLLHFPPIETVALPSLERDTFNRRQLFEWLSVRLSPPDQLKLLDRYLLPSEDGRAPDHHLLFARATLQKQEGQAQAAVETLLRIPEEQRHDEMIVLLVESAIAAQRRLPIKNLLEQMANWEDGQLAGRLVHAIAQVADEGETLELASHLCRLAPNYAQRVWQTVGTTIRTPTLRLNFIEMLEGGHVNQPNGYLRLSADEVLAYLARESDAKRLPDAVLERLVQAGMTGNTTSGLAPFLMEWLERTLRQGGAGEVAQARTWFEQARSWLSTHQSERGMVLLNDALKRVGASEQAMWLVLDYVTDAQRTGDLDSADRWLKMARDGISALPGNKRSEMLELVKEEDSNIKSARSALNSSFAPRFGNDPGLTALFELYQVDCTAAFWADMGELLRTNPFVVQQLVERLEQLNKFGQESGSTYAKIHSLTELQGNVYRLELTDQARVIFKKMGKRIRLIALYATHDAYDEAIKNRVELMNRIRQ